ncbi:Uu.00g118030.m01.CDS01 [Anthostomella pinea]|uniref:Uu.00g118030.m01.CDS01 n=1 Tax=Anthostomella pinea TaxID=933095 RepID=A0AAI8YGZ5_9PEZI|nr:Uu.00g118030.m01.CDS01 [Anthostomella pinea]
MFNHLALVFFAAVTALFGHYISAALFSSLKIFPGPFWAQFSNFWRFFNVKKHHKLQLDLHRKYGSAVRFGPNVVSFSDPALIRTLYDTRGTYPKSDFYSPMDTLLPSGAIVQNSFGTRDNTWHGQYLKPISAFYRDMKHVFALEPQIDSTVQHLCDKLSEPCAGKPASVDLERQITYLAYDAVGEITFSSRLGFIDGKGDDGHIDAAVDAVKHFARTSQVPVVDWWMTKNRYVNLGKGGFGWAADFAIARLQQRMKENEERAKTGETKERLDHLDLFMQLPSTPPEMIVSYTMQNLVAGADTVAITIQATMFHLLKNRSAYDRLTKDLLAANLSMPVQYKEACSVEYLEAVINEGLRIAPANGMSLERVVPSGGLTLPDGRFIPEGTLVGINPWVVQRDEKIYGAEVDSFKPERWLRASGEDEAAFTQRLQGMKSTMLAFGAGNRVCLGKKIAELEIYKTIATLVASFEIALEDPNAKLDQPNYWFTFVESPIMVRMQKR